MHWHIKRFRTQEHTPPEKKSKFYSNYNIQKGDIDKNETLSNQKQIPYKKLVNNTEEMVGTN